MPANRERVCHELVALWDVSTQIGLDVPKQQQNIGLILSILNIKKIKVTNIVNPTCDLIS